MAREFKWAAFRDDLYTPSSGFLNSRCVDYVAIRKQQKTFVLDGTCALLHVEEEEDVVVTPPVEWTEQQQKLGNGSKQVWRMLNTLYGRRAAPRRWMTWFTKLLLECGLQRLDAAPSFFAGKGAKVASIFLELQMDDAHGTGEDIHINGLMEMLKQRLSMKVEVFDISGGHYSHLKRERHRDGDVTWIRPNTKYITGVLSALGLTAAKSVATPAVSNEEVNSDDEIELSDSIAATYRSCVGSLLCSQSDRRDFQRECCILARGLAHPTKRDDRRLRRLGRYLEGAPDLAVKLCRPRDVSGNRLVLTVYTDADWGGSEDRRSQTACHFEADGIVLGGFSRRQACISLSSAESELYAISSGMSEGILLRRVFEHAGFCVTFRVMSDASAARAICRKEGVGNIKHMQTRVLWCRTRSRANE